MNFEKFRNSPKICSLVAAHSKLWVTSRRHRSAGGSGGGKEAVISDALCVPRVVQRLLNSFTIQNQSFLVQNSQNFIDFH